MITYRKLNVSIHFLQQNSEYWYVFLYALCVCVLEMLLQTLPIGLFTAEQFEIIFAAILDIFGKEQYKVCILHVYLFETQNTLKVSCLRSGQRRLILNMDDRKMFYFGCNTQRNIWVRKMDEMWGRERDVTIRNRSDKSNGGGRNNVGDRTV